MSTEPKVFEQEITNRFAAYRGDSALVMKGLLDNSVHFQICSPPFSSLFTYSASDHDAGNCKGDAEFFQHYGFFAEEQFRIQMPGRLCAIHVMQLPSSKTTHGVIGLRDFRGECIRLFVSKGWIYHSEVCIWKNPAVAMMRTKALGLLHKQLRKDSAMSRQGVADYLVIFRKPGPNPEPIPHTAETFPVPMWQRYASPVWATADEFDEEGFCYFTDSFNDETPGDETGAIDQGNTLQGRSAREHKDEKHIAPLQLGVIRRAVKLWTNPNDIVFTPFMGIGSEPYVALQEGRRGIGCELKESYYKQAVANLRAIANNQQGELFKAADVTQGSLVEMLQ